MCGPTLIGRFRTVLFLQNSELVRTLHPIIPLAVQLLSGSNILPSLSKSVMRLHPAASSFLSSIVRHSSVARRWKFVFDCPTFIRLTALDMVCRGCAVRVTARIREGIVTAGQGSCWTVRFEFPCSIRPTDGDIWRPGKPFRAGTHGLGSSSDG